MSPNSRPQPAARRRPPGRRPRYPALEELSRQLATEPTMHVAQRYGVCPSTMWHRRRQLGIPARRRGRVGGTGQVEAALKAAMAPDQWYPSADLRAQVPGSKQRLYELLARLCARGEVVRRGRWGHYRWCRPRPAQEDP